MTITEFLQARWDEEAADVCEMAALLPDGSHDEDWPDVDGYAVSQRMVDVARRVLADLAAKRYIVELHYSWNLQAERMTVPPFGPILQTRVNTADAILRTLARPYADHPDFDEAWRS